jgi:hypothetical protein
VMSLLNVCPPPSGPIIIISTTNISLPSIKAHQYEPFWFNRGQSRSRHRVTPISPTHIWKRRECCKGLVLHSSRIFLDILFTFRAIG